MCIRLLVPPCYLHSTTAEALLPSDGGTLYLILCTAVIIIVTDMKNGTANITINLI